jgi:hypothetical protein
MPPVLIFFLPPILVALFIGHLGLRLVRAFERRNGGTREITELSARVEQLESALEQQGAELRRLSDGQAFAEQLLAERKRDPKVLGP